MSAADITLTSSLHTLYTRLGLRFGSFPDGCITFIKDPITGTTNKKFNMPRMRQTTKSLDMGVPLRQNIHEPCVLLYFNHTNFFAIDVDDETNPTAQTIMKMCQQSCNMIEKTPHGYHYIFAHNEASASIKSVISKPNGFDIRSGDNDQLLVCTPSFYIGDGVRYEYKWITTPADNEQIAVVSDDIITFLQSLGGYWKGSNKKALKAPCGSEPVADDETETDLASCAFRKTIATSTLSDLKPLLNRLTPEWIADHSNWVRMMMLIKSTDNTMAGKREFLKQSRRAPAYDTEAHNTSNKAQWDLCKPSGEITIGSLHHWVKECNPINNDEIAIVDDEYTKMKIEFEKNHFFWSIGAETVEVQPNGEWHSWSDTKAMRALNMWLLQGKEPLFIKQWLNDPTRRIIRRRVMKKVGTEDVDEWNDFTGFAYTSITDEPISRAVDLFKQLAMELCGNDDKVFNDHIWRLNRIIHDPFTRSEVLTTFYSPKGASGEGCGKDTHFGICKAIMGKDNVAHYTSTNQLFNSYDCGRVGKVFVYLEEAGVGLQKVKEGEFKAMLSSDVISCNPKGLKAYSVPNVGHWFQSTNEPPNDAGRRLNWIQCGLGLKDNSKFFEEYYSVCYSNGGLKAIGEWIEQQTQHLDWKPNTIVKTDYMMAITAAAVSPLEEWLTQWSPIAPQSPAELYDDYIQWMTAEGNSDMTIKSAKSLTMKINTFSHLIVGQRKTWVPKQKDCVKYLKP